MHLQTCRGYLRRHHTRKPQRAAPGQDSMMRGKWECERDAKMASVAVSGVSWRSSRCRYGACGSCSCLLCWSHRSRRTHCRGPPLIQVTLQLFFFSRWLVASFCTSLHDFLHSFLRPFFYSLGLRRACFLRFHLWKLLSLHLMADSTLAGILMTDHHGNTSSREP